MKPVLARNGKRAFIVKPCPSIVLSCQVAFGRALRRDLGHAVTNMERSLTLQNFPKKYHKWSQWIQNEAKRVQEVPKRIKKDPEKVQKEPKRLQKEPKRVQRDPKRVPRGSKRVPKGSQNDPKRVP